MKNFTKAKELFIESLNQYKSNLKDNQKDNELATMIEQFKIAANNISNEDCIAIALLTYSCYLLLILVESQPTPNYPKGGIMSKYSNAHHILDSEEKTINVPKK